jgi:hypothetical protein
MMIKSTQPYSRWRGARRTRGGPAGQKKVLKDWKVYILGFYLLEGLVAEPGSPRRGRFFGRTSGPRLLAEQTSLRHLESGSVAFRSGVCVMARAPIARAFSELENMRSHLLS